jgi:hypothetical protein
VVVSTTEINNEVPAYNGCDWSRKSRRGILPLFYKNKEPGRLFYLPPMDFQSVDLDLTSWKLVSV